MNPFSDRFPIPIESQDFREDSTDPSRESEFLQGLAGAYREIYATSLAIVGNRTDADDVIQEVCVVLWRKFHEFESGTSFRKWGCAIAYNVARAYVRQQRRRRGWGLSDQALSLVEHTRVGASELLELRRDVLRGCLEKLPDADRKFILDCYRQRAPLVDYARKQEMSLASVYTRLKRLRAKLAECIHRSLGDDP